MLQSPVGAPAEGGGQEGAVPETGQPPGGPVIVNGGFPEPPLGEPVRIVRCRHDCGAETAVRIPAYLPAAIVQRVICSGCGAELRAFDPALLRQKLHAEEDTGPAELRASADAATEPPASDDAIAVPALDVPAPDDAEAPAPAAEVPAPAEAPVRRRRRIHVSNRAWQLISVPLIVGAVVGALLLLNGNEKSPRRVTSTAAAGSAAAAAPGDARFIHAGNYSLALPPGWKVVQPHGGAVFRAVSEDGSADATLWIERNPSMTFAQFQKRSLANLKNLADNATVHQRLPAPNGSGTIVQLRAEVPTGGGISPYLVTLRAAGPYRYYLATSVQPEAATEVRNEAALIHGSFTPEAGPATETPPAGAPAGAAP